MGAPQVSPAFVLRGSCVGRHYALPVLAEEVIASHTPPTPRLWLELLSQFYF